MDPIVLHYLERRDRLDDYDDGEHERNPIMDALAHHTWLRLEASKQRKEAEQPQKENKQYAS